MTLGSLFDGIGGWLLAARHAGVTPVWASEIEPFPCSVTARHFPDVKQLGDITQIDLDEIEPVDIVCAGSPCQDLSIAGKRKGLDGERSGLFHTAINIVRRMRERTAGEYPRFFVWENVPGAFSSNRGMDFQAVLEEIGESKIPMSQGNRWAAAGLVQCPRAEIAWRVLDAQYWGVPQRRRRIFLVADFAADDRRAGEILFEPEGMSGDPAASTREREGTARGTADCARTSGALTPWDVQSRRIYDENGKMAALYSGEGQGAHNGAVFIRAKVYDVQQRTDVIRKYDGSVPTLTGRMGTGGHNVPIVHVFCIAGNTIDRKLQNGANGKGILAETAYTLNTIDRHAVAEIYGAESYCVGNGQVNGASLQEKTGALNCMHDQQVILTSRTIRRLTPTECERLQGLPDGYTEGGSDTARYKALGNGMAQPCATYIIKRIVECAEEVR